MTKDYLFNEAKKFFDVFEPRGDILVGVKVPGSINMLGEYTDFNNGEVLNTNIDKEAFLMAQKRKENDRSVNFYLQKYKERLKIYLNEPNLKEGQGWSNYIASTLFMLESAGKKVAGMNVYIDNNIPDEFNAKSMEALEVGVTYISEKFGDWELEKFDIADVCSQGEKNYMNVEKNPTKYASIIFGEKGKVTFFDLKNKKYENLDLNTNKYVFIIMSFGLKNKFTKNKQEQILKETKEAINILKQKDAKFNTLDELTMEEFDEYRKFLTITQRKRCAYFISENERVKKANVYLKKNDVENFLDVINDSQNNIRKRLDIIEKENEIFASVIENTKEVRAYRLLNMGVDGTFLLVVEKDKLHLVETKVKRDFFNKTGLNVQTQTINFNSQIEEVTINVQDFKKDDNK